MTSLINLKNEEHPKKELFGVLFSLQFNLFASLKSKFTASPKKNRSAMRTWVLCFMLVCFYSFRLEFCFKMSVSGSLTAASEKVEK